MSDIEKYLEKGIQPEHDLQGVVRHAAAYKGHAVDGLVGFMPAVAGQSVPADEDVVQLARDLGVLGVQINNRAEFEIIRGEVVPSPEFKAFSQCANTFNPVRERHQAREQLDALVQKKLGR